VWGLPYDAFTRMISTRLALLSALILVVAGWPGPASAAVPTGL
jgi:hypothetical protein